MEAAEEVCQGRIALVLEGGYNLRALAASVMACLEVLSGNNAIVDPLGPSSEPEPDISALIARMRQNHPCSPVRASLETLTHRRKDVRRAGL